MLVSEVKAYQHHGCIAGSCSDCTSKISEFWNEQKIKEDGDDCPANSDVGSGFGAVGKLVPDGEIVIDSQKDLGKHQNGYDVKSLQIFRMFIYPHKVLPYIQVKGDAQET